MRFLILVGALIGLAVNGWRGALIGGLAVWALLPLVGRLLLGAAVAKVKQLQGRFVDATFSVMGAVCKADGRVSAEEIRAAEAMFQRLNLDEAGRETARAAFNRGKSADFDLDAEVARFAEATRRQPVFRQIFLQVQVSAVAADGGVHPAEHAMLTRIARGLGMSERDVAMLEAMMRGDGDGFGPPGGGAGHADRDLRRPGALEDAYSVLGVPADTSDAELKRAYRRLMSENHPDKLAAKGMPESMRALAEEKTRRITAAYQLIERARGGIKA